MKKIIIRSNNPKIKFPYILITPDEMSPDAHLIVDLEGTHSSKLSFKEQIEQKIKENEESSSMDFISHEIMIQLGYPVIVPIIPRKEDYYTTYLGSQIKNNYYDNTSLTEEDKEIIKDLDEQIKLMIEEATSSLNIQKKAIIKGYSATAKFATQFSILHPEVIAMNISGGTGGLSTLPLKEYKGIELPYPFGVADIDNFNMDEFLKVRHFFYIGDQDENNPALPKCKMSTERDLNGNLLPEKDQDGNLQLIYDENGELSPTFPECYNKEEINLIHSLFGDDNQIRFDQVERIYHDLGIDSTHQKYPGEHITIFKYHREEIINDIITFIKKNTKKKTY